MRSHSFRHCAPGLAAILALLAPPTRAGESFTNWESPHVHPLDLTADGRWLLAVDTADAALEIFDAAFAAPVPVAAVPVGLDPVSVRARTSGEAWVVNRISDSLSIVDLATREVRSTLPVCDAPGDVVFAAGGSRAFVSCPMENRLVVLMATAPWSQIASLPIAAERPRALAVSPAGDRVYAAILESGNRTTVLPGGHQAGGLLLSFLPNAVDDPAGPYAGRNPPPNDGDAFRPPIRSAFLPSGATPAPPVALVVRQGADGRWLDDNDHDWSRMVSGDLSAHSGRPAGWTLLDHDVAIVDAASLAVGYADHLMTLGMALAVRPSDGRVTLVGTEAGNQIRFEANVKARFSRVMMAGFAPAAPGAATIVDLNAGHLDYSDAEIAAQSDPGTASQELRERSLGDPRAVVWNAAGTRGYVAGMGSNNVAVIGPAGERLPPLGDPGAAAIAVGEGPTGLALDAARGRLFVLERFAAAVATVRLADETVVARARFFDPTPPAIRAGRPFLYDTHRTSGLGQVACASCHVDARFDRLSWDLGDPAGDVLAADSATHNLGAGLMGPAVFGAFHPMKGPMLTQTLQDIVGKEPHHWRGDRHGLEEFAGAFHTLLGDDRDLDPVEMQQLEDFLATIAFPPNPNRNLDNSLPVSLPLPGHHSVGRFAAQDGLPFGAPMPPGNAQHGLELYRPPNFTFPTLFVGACSTCHTLPSGTGTQDFAINDVFQPIPPGPDGEERSELVSVDHTSNPTLKVPYLRTVGERGGMDVTQTENSVGFGYSHDGAQDSLVRFLSSFKLHSDQDISDLVAFLLSFTGSGLPGGSLAVGDLEPPGPPSHDSHAAVGRQLEIDATNQADPGTVAYLDQLAALADAGAVDLVGEGRIAGQARGYRYAGGGLVESDVAGETTTLAALRAAVAAAGEITFTVVPAGGGVRLGIDRDLDGFRDGDERDACADARDPASTPANAVCVLFADGFESGDGLRWSAVAGL
jgi:DNA-binding beta-propeller fold protein YncE